MCGAAKLSYVLHCTIVHGSELMLVHRFFDVELCPVSVSAADHIVAELSQPRLRFEHLGKAFVLRAPSGLGHASISAQSFTAHIGRTLRAAGVRCDLTEKGASGKPSVCH